jgi:hypothetical protein
MKSYIIIPGFDSSSHRALYEKICTELDCKGLILTPLKKYYISRILIHSIYSLLQSLPSLVGFLLKKDIRPYTYDGFNFGRSINEEGLSRSSIGRFSIFNNGLYYIFKAHITYHIIRKIIKTHKIKMIIGGDDAYIVYSILSQIAVKKSIPVFYIKGMNKITLREWDPKFYTSMPPYEKLYKKYRNKISKEILDQSEKSLIERCNGIKTSLSFMPLERKKYKNNFEGDQSIIMFLHDLFDSPGIYGGNLFQSHVDWIESTIKFFKKKNLKLYVKIHPNEREISKKLSHVILDYYKDGIEVINGDVNLVELKKSGLKAIITVFGTISIEAGYIGIPVISAGRSPFTCGRNLKIPKNISEYFEMIEFALINKLPIPDKNEAIKLEALNISLNWYLPTIDKVTFNDITKEDWKAFFNSKFPSTLYERRKHYMGSKNFYKYLKNKYIGINFTNDGNFNVLSKALVKTN